MEGMDKLQQSLLDAKRFMNHNALNSPSGTKQSMSSAPIETPTMEMPPNININESSIPTTPQMSMTPKSNMTKEAILSSKLPDAIKKAMLENPIPDPTPTGTLSPDFINEVSKKMNSPQYSINEMRATSNSNIQTSTIPTPNKMGREIKKQQNIDPIPSLSPLNDIPSSDLKSTIKECLKEIMVEENLLVEQKNLKETLQLRVGNKIFSGTIKSVRTIKK